MIVIIAIILLINLRFLFLDINTSTIMPINAIPHIDKIQEEIWLKKKPPSL